jgi:hypothetical protein
VVVGAAVRAFYPNSLVTETMFEATWRMCSGPAVLPTGQISSNPLSCHSPGSIPSESRQASSTSLLCRAPSRRSEAADRP